MKNLSRLRLARLIEGMTLDELGKTVNLDVGLLSRAERNLYCLTKDQKSRIAAALHLSVDQAFGESEK